jgi:hypothetical protein
LFLFIPLLRPIMNQVLWGIYQVIKIKTNFFSVFPCISPSLMVNICLIVIMIIFTIPYIRGLLGELRLSQSNKQLIK